MDDHFGHAIALHGDTLAVGVYKDSDATDMGDDQAPAPTGIGGDQDDDSADSSGAVYVFN